MKLDYRLALDLGTNSIGWCVYKIAGGETDHPDERWHITSIHRMGVRIFSDGRNPKDLASLAASRRVARQARRRRDRSLQRKQQLINQLIELGLMPKDDIERKALTILDPYALRAKGLSEALHPYHFGRALFHLARKRGFRSGRKDRQTEENAKESGKIDSGIKNLRSKLTEKNCNTVGQYLAQLHILREPVLARPNGDGSYPIYLARELVEDEFDELWRAQAAYRPDILTSTARDKLRHTIMFQRKLKPVKPGKCLYERDQPRALLAHPLSQRFRILQELANLRVQLSPSQQRGLTRIERDQLLSVLTYGDATLLSRGLLTWAKLKNALKIPKEQQKHVAFNLDTSGRKGLKADTVSIMLSQADAVGDGWRTWPANRQDDFLHQIRKADSRAELSALLAEFQFSENQLSVIFEVAATMPDDFGSVSLVALQKIVPALETDVVHYDEAVVRAGYNHHSNFYDGEQMPSLPYYGQRLPGYTQPRDLPGASAEEREHGRIPNPTVHVGLNQLRKIVNAIIKRYGHPKQIIIEVARNLGLSGENRRKLEKEQRENRERNERFGEELIKRGIRNSRENRQRLQLFEEIANNDPLGAECIYTGERISPTKLFSDEIEIDHILPFSRSLDDGIGNKVLCFRRANRDKKDLTPFEAFRHSQNSYVWEDILSRAERLVPRKAKRFRENALEDFLRDSDFLARHLNDTAYFSRVAREYLTAICPPNCVWVSTGRLTSMLRGKWGLNRILSDADRKDRTDHRHHAVDAAVIGACDRSLIKAMADAAHRAEDHGESRLLEKLPPPWPSFFDDVKATTEKIVVSHKPDHSLSGGLHNETIYGLLEGPDAKGRPLVVHRVPLASITKRGDLGAIADSALRARLLDATAGKDGIALKAALSAYGTRAAISMGEAQRVKEWIKENVPEYETKSVNAKKRARQKARDTLGISEHSNVSRVRISERLSVQAIANPGRGTSNYVKTDGNYCYEIVRDANGKWRGYAVSLFEANRMKNLSRTMGVYGDNLVMRLHVDDIVATGDNHQRRLYRIAQITDAFVTLAEHFEAGNLRARHADVRDSFRYIFPGASALRGLCARVSPVDELGYVNDPGFKE